MRRHAGVQSTGGTGADFLPKNVTLAVAALSCVSKTVESGPWVSTVNVPWPARLPSASSQVTTALVVPLTHVKVVKPPAVQVIEFVGLAAPTGATRIAEAKAVARSVPIRGFFITFIVLLTLT